MDREFGPSPTAAVRVAFHLLGRPGKARLGKTQGQPNYRKASGGLFLGVTTVSASKKTHPENIWLKVRHMTTGTGQIDNDSQWSRSQETSGS